MAGNDPRWTDAETDALRAAWASGETIKSIAARHGRTRYAIGVRLADLGLWRQKRPRWTAEERADLREMADDGVQYSTIAEWLGRSVNAVACQVRASRNA